MFSVDGCVVQDHLNGKIIGRGHKGASLFLLEMDKEEGRNVKSKNKGRKNWIKKKKKIKNRSKGKKWEEKI